MKDPYTHAEKTPLPGFGSLAMRALVAQALGVALGPPQTVSTGCGLQRPFSSTSTIPEQITCPACREQMRGQCLPWRTLPPASSSCQRKPPGRVLRPLSSCRLRNSTTAP